MLSNRAILILSGSIMAVIVAVLAFRMVKTKDVTSEHVYTSGVSVPEDKSANGILAIVLDDCGYSKSNLTDIEGLKVPVTLAVLPDTSYAEYVSRFGRKNDKEVIVHMPMEPLGQGIPLEKSTLMVGMGKDEVRELISGALVSVPGAVGVNNHMGSKFTADTASMKMVMDELKERDLFFLDSLTNGKSVCSAIARSKRINILVRDVFIDNKNDEEYIRGQMDKIGEWLEEGKTVVAIGHDRPNTITVLEEYVPKFKDSGVKFTTLEDLLKGKDN